MFEYMKVASLPRVQLAVFPNHSTQAWDHGRVSEGSMPKFLVENTRPGKLSHNYGTSPFLMGKTTISIVIFNSYVKLPEGKFPTSWLALFQALALIVKVSVKIYRELSFWTTTSANSFTARHFSFLYSYQSPSCCTLAQFGLSWHGVMSIIPIDTHVFERKQYHKSI